MGFFSNLFGSDRKKEKISEEYDFTEQAVLIYIPLSDDEFGSQEEREAIHKLSDELSKAIETAGTGEFDGDEFGGGECTLFMYGPDADSLYNSIEPVLRASTLTKGGRAVKRHAAPGEKDEEILL